MYMNQISSKSEQYVVNEKSNICLNVVCWLVVFYVPSTEGSFRDGTTIYCPLQMT